jgi:hypothetical protein
MSEIIDTMQSAAAYAVLVVAAVEAVRKRVPFDGWRVLVVAAGISLAIAALFIPAASMPELLAALRIAAVSWLLAVGGDAWASKIVAKGKTVGSGAFDPSEAPTKKEG